MFNDTFNNISVIYLWWSVLLVEETGIPEENHPPVASHWQTLSYNVASSTPRLSRVQTRNVSGDRHSCKGSCKSSALIINSSSFKPEDKQLNKCLKLFTLYTCTWYALFCIVFFICIRPKRKIWIWKSLDVELQMYLPYLIYLKHKIHYMYLPFSYVLEEPHFHCYCFLIYWLRMAR